MSRKVADTQRSTSPPLQSDRHRPTDNQYAASLASTSLSQESLLGTPPPKRRKWFFAWLNQISLELENSGSVARDHLALERTWLAYVRTSLSVASAGVALVQLFAITAKSNPDVHRFARPLGAASVGIGIVVLLVGLWRFFDVQNALSRGKFSPARMTIILFSAAMAVITASVFGFVITAQAPPSGSGGLLLKGDDAQVRISNIWEH